MTKQTTFLSWKTIIPGNFTWLLIFILVLPPSTAPIDMSDDIYYHQSVHVLHKDIIFSTTHAKHMYSLITCQFGDWP